MSVVYKDIDDLSQKSSVAGTEKIPVSDTEYITPGQIVSSAIQSFSEADPVFSASAAAGITSSDITNWNLKGNAKIFYGTSTSNQSTSYKYVDCSNFNSSDLADGVLLHVRFIYNNTVSSPGINIANHYASIKKIYNGELVAATRYDIVAGASILFEYRQYDDYWLIIASSIAEELPNVTTSDNGKVLSVVSGKWEASTIASGEVSDVTVGGTSVVSNGVAAVPAIPTVNDSTITIQMNGSTVDSFTTNASSAKTINLGTVITSHQSLSGYAKYVLCADEAAYTAIQNKDSGTLYLIPET